MDSGMTIGQDFAVGGQTIALGLMVVFLCLALIIVIMVVMSALLKERRKETGEALKPAPVKAMPDVPTVTVQDDELLAVLTAAVAAAMESQQTGAGSTPFVIRSYKKVNGRAAWGRAGKESQLTNW